MSANLRRNRYFASYHCRYETGILTLSDRYGLLAASLDEGLDEDERRAVSLGARSLGKFDSPGSHRNRILRAVKRGKIQMAAA
ncbi:MAG: hypothetical protein AAGA60_23500 [Cyanobacteria bacterium P01_E01_bin.42]